MEETYKFDWEVGTNVADYTRLPVQMIFDRQNAKPSESKKLTPLTRLKGMFGSITETSNVADPKLKSLTYEDLKALYNRYADELTMSSPKSVITTHRNSYQPVFIDSKIDQSTYHYLSDFDYQEYPAEFTPAPTESENIATLADEMRDNPAFGIM